MNEQEVNHGYRQSQTEQQSQPLVHPNQRETSKGRFFIGFAVGMAVCAFLLVILFVIFYPRLRSGVFVSSDSEELLDEATVEKINLLNGYIDEYYYLDSEVSIDDRREGLFDGIMGSLDDVYSVYYTEEEATQLTMQTTGIYYGIGAYISFDQATARAYISGIIDDSPASESELRENDIIMYVDGVTTESLTTEAVANMVKGEEGTDVTLTVSRDGEEIDITITRRKVESKTVSYEMLEDGIGYLQITEFDGVTTAQFTEAYDNLTSQGMKGLILDLRSNPGGQLDTVCEIANELLPAGNIVYTVDKNGYKEEYKSDGKNEIQIPLVVLVNQNSASASEILAGAIKDYGIGTLVGKTTYGKGIVQRIFFFEDGTGIKVTVSSYYTPNGNNIHGIGIEPDVDIDFDSDAYAADGTDNQLEKAIEVIKGQI